MTDNLNNYSIDIENDTSKDEISNNEIIINSSPNSLSGMTEFSSSENNKIVNNLFKLDIKNNNNFYIDENNLNLSNNTNNEKFNIKINNLKKY